MPSRRIHVERFRARGTSAIVVGIASRDGAGTVGSGLRRISERGTRGSCRLVVRIARKDRHKATLFGMYVPPRFRSLGLGRQLVVATLEFARSRAGIKIVQLTVSQGNASAETLYRRCGFIEFGVEPFAVAVASGYVSKVHMWWAVDPSVNAVLSRS